MNTIIIVGAARSGTKILRDTLATGLAVGAVPYDIGYIWNPSSSRGSDELKPSELSTRQIRNIRKFIGQYARNGAVVEKTVANTLRVPAVTSVFPNAVIVSLVRDGVDVTMSAARQWSARPEIPYIMQKIRHFPVSLMPTYGWDYLRSTIQRFRGSGAVPAWGPRYPGIDKDIKNLPLEVVCARQWVQSVGAARAAISQLAQPVVDVKYERFVLDPTDVITRVGSAIDRTPDPEAIRKAVAMIHRGQQGKCRAAVPSHLRSVLADQLNQALKIEGYEEIGTN